MKEVNGVPTTEPIKIKDHLMDAIRYAIYTYYIKYLRPRRRGRVITALSVAKEKKEMTGDSPNQNGTRKPPLGDDVRRGDEGEVDESAPAPTPDYTEDERASKGVSYGRKKGRVFIR